MKGDQPQAVEPAQVTIPLSPKKELGEEPTETEEELERITEELYNKVDNWHGLDFTRWAQVISPRDSPLLTRIRFGPLRLHSKLQVGKDRRSWQELECYLFAEMLICVKEKKGADQAAWDDDDRTPRGSKATLKGSIMIKKHLNNVETSTGKHGINSSPSTTTNHRLS